MSSKNFIYNKKIILDNFNKGKFENKNVFVKKGPYGIYCEIGKTRFSIDDENIGLDTLITLYNHKNKNIIKEWNNIKILNGPYGPYIKKGNKNTSIPKDINPENLTLNECENIIKSSKKKTGKFKKYSTM